ncbi:MAG: tRNA dihydrouridine synthase [Nitrospinaceae bacterium]
MNSFPNKSTREQNPVAKPVPGRGLISQARNPFWLAPMAGITDVVFRKLMDEMGAGVLISELVSAKGLLHNSEKTRKLICIHPDPGTLVGIQLFGESAEDIIAAGAIVREAGASFIDINLGCPVKKVVKKGCGAALMRDPAYLESFLDRIRRGIGLPLTVKMRTGWSEAELTIHECVKAAGNAGCEWAAIHGRTRAQGYEGRADWDIIREVKKNAGLPVVGNGDIRDAEAAKKCLEESGVDAVMIGRGAIRNPWIFRECLGQSGREALSPLGLLSRYRMELEKVYDTRITLILLRKFSTRLVYGYPGAAAFRRRMFQCPSSGEVMKCAADYFCKVADLPPPKFSDSEAFMMGGHG